MAIYKGRDVTILHEVKQPQTNPIHIMIRYQDGQSDYVPMGELQVTSEEKKTLEKSNMTKYDNLQVITTPSKTK